MFHMPWLGARLALAHYIGALGVGLIFRFYGLRTPRSGGAEPAAGRPRGNLLRRAALRLLQAQAEDGRPLGQILGEAVTDSVKTLLMICGFIMLFSVFVRIAQVIGLEQLLAVPLRSLFHAIGIDRNLVPAALAGLFEIDLGSVAAAGAGASLAQRALMASIVIAWSGLSVHAQVASVLAGTDIRMAPYAVARLLHAIIAGAATLWLLPTGATRLLPAAVQPAVTAFAAAPDAPTVLQGLARGLSWAALVPMALVLLGAGLGWLRRPN